MTFKVITITPEIAGKMLETHAKAMKGRDEGTGNRTINDNYVKQLADEMKNGEWVLNGEAVKTADTGRLLDGQHRVWAAFNHDVSFETHIVTGLDEEAFLTIDIGRPRRAADFLNASGVKRGSLLAAASRLVMAHRHKNEMKTIHMIKKREVVEFCLSHPRLQDSVAAVISSNTFTPSVLAAWHFVFSEQNAALANEFIRSLIDGIDLKKGNPVLALRELMIKNKASRAKLRSQDLFIRGMVAWNSYAAGKPRVRLTEAKNKGAGVGARA